MPLIIGTTPNSQWQALTPLLNHLGWQNQQESPEKGYQNTGNVDENTQYLLLHSRPELAVAHAMDAGASPKEALAEWRNAAEQLLAFYKQHRRQAVMVDAGSAALAPQELIGWLRENRPAFSSQAPWPKEAPELTIPGPNQPLNQLLATQLVAQDHVLAGLLAQLEAASIPLADSTQPELDIEALHNELAKQKSAATEEQHKDVLEENDLILKQLFKVQEELEKYYLECKNLQRAQETTEAEHKAAIQAKNEKLKRFSQEKRTLQSENKELMKILERTEEALLELRANVGSGSSVKGLVKTLRGVTRSSRRIKEQVQVVQSSDLFDERWYLRQNPDVASKFDTAAEHYVIHGGQEGRAPGPNFSSKKYLEKYPDVADSGQNPLVHYLLHGKAEGRKP